MRVYKTVVATIAAFSLAACSQMQGAPPPDFKFKIAVESDPGVPVAGASISRAGREIAKSDATGSALLAFKGAEGDTVDLYVKCPADFLSPTRPINVRFSTLADDKVLSETVRCAPTSRQVFVSVRAENGPNLPVMYLGREMARTDASGAASFLLRGKPAETLQFTLDTNAKSFERLRPQNPVLSLLVNDRDDVYPIGIAFALQKQVVITVQRQGPRAIGPQPLH